jgi:uncharacterized protein YcsI (UPF0317 family)
MEMALTPSQQARLDIREGRHTGTTRGLALGYVQCNLVVITHAPAHGFITDLLADQFCIP